MENTHDQIARLLSRLDVLQRNQHVLSAEIIAIRMEVQALQQKPGEPEKVAATAPVDIPKSLPVNPLPPQPARQETLRKKVSDRAPVTLQMRSNLEKFIGENLISKIGIIILIIGVAIGAKYSIEHDLISPLTRIILGYLAGLAILVIGFRLRSKYEGYSAVLVSGAMAVLYFMTYAAYDYYALIPQVVAFGLMVLFTAFTVVAALQYNRQVIAHIGLVGSYAVPFLLSDGSGNIAVLFSYMAIINAGILIIAIRKYWKLLSIFSFSLTWLIFLGWYLFDFNFTEHFTLAFVFASIFFITFYASFLSYKVLYKEVFQKGDIVLILSNAFLFFGIGYSLLDQRTSGMHFLGLFTLVNALIHFLVAMSISRLKLADKNLFYLIAGLVLVFITIAIPVQLDGNWVTMLWSCEAALLFWIGSKKQIAFYERLSYVLMVVATFSLLQDWSVSYAWEYFSTPIDFPVILNKHFLTSLVFIAAFGFIQAVQSKHGYNSLKDKNNPLSWLTAVIPAVLVAAVYFAFRLEITHYWDLQHTRSIEVAQENTLLPQSYSDDILRFKHIWVLNYSLFFLSALSVVNWKKIRNKILGLVSGAFLAITILLFLSAGLLILGELRTSYLNDRGVGTTDLWNIYIRYISFVFLALGLYILWRSVRALLPGIIISKSYDILLHLSILAVASSELIHWLDMAGSDQTYKLGISILWGFYSLLLIILGLWKNKKHLRLAAIILFGITLLKLFLYDISQLSTMAKTVVFISLGILLLIISFLYNKYNSIISNDSNK